MGILNSFVFIIFLMFANLKKTTGIDCFHHIRCSPVSELLIEILDTPWIFDQLGESRITKHNGIGEILDEFIHSPDTEESLLQKIQDLSHKIYVVGNRFDDFLNCPLALGSAYVKLSSYYIAALKYLKNINRTYFEQRLHNSNQLAMSMYWQTLSTSSNPEECFSPGSEKYWGTDWDLFMQLYLSHAYHIRRHTEMGLPSTNGDTERPVHTTKSGYKIMIMSVCDYHSDNSLYGIDGIVFPNKIDYAEFHGYQITLLSSVVGIDEFIYSPGSRIGGLINHEKRHPTWYSVLLPLAYITGYRENNAYDGKDVDWIFSMDCDAMFVNKTITLDYLINHAIRIKYQSSNILNSGFNKNLKIKEVDPFFIISEDGRGLAGGNWFVKNNKDGQYFLESLLKQEYDSHTLRDQFSILYTLVRGGAHYSRDECKNDTILLDHEVLKSGGVKVEHSINPTICEIGYSPGTRLLPQYMLNSYPWFFCQPSHHCFQSDTPKDFIVSFITLSHLSRNMAFAMLLKFSHEAETEKQFDS